MKESEARIAIAKTQNEIFKRIFNNISENEFNPNIDLTGISTNALRDYWTYSIGFLVVQNFENFGINLSDDNLKELVQGHFKLKYLTDAEAKNLKSQSRKPAKVKGTKETTKLYTIQDGTYSILTNKAAKSENQRHQLLLDTDSPKYYSDNNNLDLTAANLLQVLRNLFAHAAPYVYGPNIIFLKKDDIVEIPKMWLRGYSELFSQTHKQFDVDFIIKNLSKELAATNNNLETSQDIDKALSIIKDILFETMPSNSFRINNFIKTRLRLNQNFNTLPLDEKISTIAHLFANNPNYIQSNAETINPTIIYNLQQLMSEELFNRNELIDMSMANIDFEALMQLDKAIKQEKLNIDNYERLHHPYKTPAEKVQIKRMIEKYNAMIREYKLIISDLSRQTALESTLMTLYKTDGLKYMPVEVAVNTVCLMGFNALVTSAYYDDLIFNSKPHDLTEKQQNYFGNLSLNSITYTHNDTKYKRPYDSYTKFFILKELRNAICHGLITYQIPNSKVYDKLSFKDIEITFFVDYENAEISGKLIDFYNLFSNDKIFYKKRPDSIITGPQRELTETGEPILDDESSGNNSSQPQN